MERRYGLARRGKAAGEDKVEFLGSRKNRTKKICGEKQMAQRWHKQG